MSHNPIKLYRQQSSNQLGHLIIDLGNGYYGFKTLSGAEFTVHEQELYEVLDTDVTQQPTKQWSTL